MEVGALGKVYEDGEIIIQQGEVGNCMYVIQEGKAEVLIQQDDQEVQIAIRGDGDIRAGCAFSHSAGFRSGTDSDD